MENRYFVFLCIFGGFRAERWWLLHRNDKVLPVKRTTMTRSMTARNEVTWVQWNGNDPLRLNYCHATKNGHFRSEEAEKTTTFYNNVVAGCVDYYGRPVLRSKSGRWRSASVIICVEMAERFAYYGINSNLINYLNGPLGQSTAAAAENVNAWFGTAALTPLLDALVADFFLGRYQTTVFASLLCILSSDCQTTDNANACSPPQLQVVLFFFSLYLVAIAQEGHKPCVQAFGADQFDPLDPKECKARSSFFNRCSFFFSTTYVVLYSHTQHQMQYLLFGITEVFTMVGLQEFSYDQLLREFRRIDLSLYLSSFGVGSFLSSFCCAFFHIFVIEKTTGGDRDGRISYNLNRGHLDYFYWLLSGLRASLDGFKKSSL
ncbi:protein NRT1/ PTR FAMILY 5.10-like [Lycium ferocissimum]|uniref:protein NRT1/ PTR FAMILY 5.10-like n=1 Tax=Lycium ferocissimum TaxID=112874 RepID=UPI0028149C28|nr:protein NRT1/ PTR FAMILY 5.10-like [Lycium ferocissimum]